MERVRGMDAAFLEMETPSMHLHVVGVLVLDPSEMGTSGTLPPERLAAVFADRLHLIPPFRRRMVAVPGGFDHPRWIDDPDFDLGEPPPPSPPRPRRRPRRARAVRRRGVQHPPRTRPPALGDVAGRRLRRRDRRPGDEGPPRADGRLRRWRPDGLAVRPGARARPRRRGTPLGGRAESPTRPASWPRPARGARARRAACRVRSSTPWSAWPVRPGQSWPSRRRSPASRRPRRSTGRSPPPARWRSATAPSTT